jgi:hypothetical protein
VGHSGPEAGDPSTAQFAGSGADHGDAVAGGRNSWTAKKTVYVLAGLLAVVAVALAGMTTLHALRASPEEGECAHQEVKPAAADSGTITLAPRTPTQLVVVVFGATRDPQIARMDFQSQEPLPIARGVAMTTYVGEFTRSDGFRYPTPMAEVTDGMPVPIAASAVVAGRTTVRLTVCFDPAGPDRVAPGTYVGTVAVDDDALASPVLATFSISLKYPDAYGPLVLALMAALAAAYLMALANPAQTRFRTWFTDHEHLSAITFGVAGALAVYGALYLRSPDWGVSGLLAAGSLFAAAFTAATTGIAAHAAGKNASGGGQPSVGINQV